MRILFIADGCHPSTQGGIQTFGRSMKKIFEKELFFISYKTNKNKLFYVEDNIEIGSSSLYYRILNKFFKNFLRDFFSKKIIKEMKPEVCLLRSPQNLELLKEIKCKKILVQHINFDLYFKSKSYYNSNYNLLSFSKRELDYFIVTSPKDKEKFVNNLQFPSEKIKVIRHSCNMSILEKNKEKNKNLIMIARLDNKQKRFDLAIKAMKGLPDFILNIYGSGSDKRKLENLIKKENLKNIILHGETDQVKEALDKNSIFLMTSDYEGYPIAVIEAMRRGLPIILRDTFEGASDIVINNGILLKKEWNEEEFYKGIKKIYSDYEFYSKNSIEMGKRHDLEIIKKEWEKIII